MPHAIRLSPLAEELAVAPADAGKVQVKLPAFDLAEGVLLTADAARADAVQKELQDGLKKAAELSVAVLFNSRVLTETVCDKLGSEMTGRERNLLRRGAGGADRALTALRAGDHAQAYKLSRTGLLPYRRLQAQMLKQAWDYAQTRNLPRESWPKLNIFPSLPNFYAIYKEGKQAEPDKLGEAYQKRWRALDLPGYKPL